MKKILLSLVAMMIATVSFAQNTLIASLQHGDEITMFYGEDALLYAVKQAKVDDIIVLSPGSFNGCEIDKKLTIRGAGIDLSCLTGYTNFKYTASNVRAECMTINTLGNYFSNSMCDATLVKVHIKKLNSYPSSIAWFENCIVDNFGSNSTRGFSPDPGTCYFINCKLGNIAYTCYMVMNNCTINQNNVSDLRNSRIINSIIWSKSESSIEGKLPSSVSNTLAAGNYTNIFDNVAPEKNCQVVGMDVFEESNPENDLTEEAKLKYVGVDGTPVGIFGGQLPFNTNNPYPRISKMNVGAVTTADGKLSVEIEVSTAE